MSPDFYFEKCGGIVLFKLERGLEEVGKGRR